MHLGYIDANNNNIQLYPSSSPPSTPSMRSGGGSYIKLSPPSFFNIQRVNTGTSSRNEIYDGNVLYTRIKSSDIIILNGD